VHDAEADSATERSALVALYNSTQGTQWRRSTNWLSSKPVAEWYGVEVESERVVKVGLKNNSLRGVIPPIIGKLRKLKTLVLSENFLTGIVPSELGDCSSLERVMLDDNELEGELPGELGGLGRLTHLYLGENRLEGEVPEELGCCDSLRNLSVWGNKLTGPFPVEAFEGCEGLCFLDVHHNHFTQEEVEELEEGFGGQLLGHNIITSGQTGKEE
jgi:hypothetical protein